MGFVFVGVGRAVTVFVTVTVGAGGVTETLIDGDGDTSSGANAPDAEAVPVVKTAIREAPIETPAMALAMISGAFLLVTSCPFSRVTRESDVLFVARLLVPPYMMRDDRLGRLGRLVGYQA